MSTRSHDDAFRDYEPSLRARRAQLDRKRSRLNADIRTFFIVIAAFFVAAPFVCTLLLLLLRLLKSD